MRRAGGGQIFIIYVIKCWRTTVDRTRLVCDLLERPDIYGTQWLEIIPFCVGDKRNYHIICLILCHRDPESLHSMADKFHNL